MNFVENGKTFEERHKRYNYTMDCTFLAESQEDAYSKLDAILMAAFDNDIVVSFKFDGIEDLKK